MGKSENDRFDEEVLELLSALSKEEKIIYLEHLCALVDKQSPVLFHQPEVV